MTTSDQPDPPAQQTAGRKSGLIVELGPVVVFVLAYNIARRFVPDDAMFIATALFMAATFSALCWSWVRHRHLPGMLIASGVVIGVFGTLTLTLRDPLFIKLKPTIINLLYAGILFGGLVVRRNVWKMLFAKYWSLPDAVWNILALRWGMWFVFLAAVNEIVWRSFSESFWVNFKLWGIMPLTMMFALANLPLIQKSLGADGAAGETGR